MKGCPYLYAIFFVKQILVTSCRMKRKLLHNISANTLQVIITQYCGLAIFYLLSAGLGKKRIWRNKLGTGRVVNCIWYFVFWYRSDSCQADSFGQ